MAYTICDEYGRCKPLHLIVTDAHDEPYVAKEFTPHWWVCDPCNPSSSRYEVTYHAGQEKPTGLAWYQVVTSDDKDDDIVAKLAHYRKVIEARKALDEARRNYERLVGR